MPGWALYLCSPMFRGLPGLWYSMHVPLLPVPSPNFLGQGQACEPLCPIWTLPFLKAVGGMAWDSCPWGPLCQTAVGRATCWPGRREEGHLSSARLQNVSGNRWEGLNVGALQNIFLQPPPTHAAWVNVWAQAGRRGFTSSFLHLLTGVSWGVKGEN